VKTVWYASLVIVVVSLSAGCGSTKTVTKTVTVDPTAKTGLGPPGEYVQFGYIKSLERKGPRYELRFDPALFLSGETANRAAIEDKVLEPGDVVPNDNYVRNESHRLLTYLVAPAAHVTVLANPGNKGILATPITVAELAQLVKGEKPKRFKLFEDLNTGFWIRVNIDTVRSLDQQYHP
jgi:hypothetical protein